MADKSDEVTLASVFKDLASSLTDAINADDSDDEESTDSDQEDESSDDSEEKTDKKDDDGESSDESDDDESSDDETDEFDAKAEISKVSASVDSIKTLLTAEDGDFRKSLTEMVKTLQTHTDVLEKALERIELLESGTAVSKSIDSGDDGDDGDSGDSDEAKALSGLHKAVTHMARNPAGAPSR